MAQKKTSKKSQKNAGLTALPLGGVGEIGMNMMVYECDGDMVLVDAGISFADEYAPGVDAIVPDTYYIRERIRRLRGVIITHAHEDHIGAMPYIWEDLGETPVYVTPFARSVLELKLKEMDIEPAPNQIVTVQSCDITTISKNFTVEYVPVTHSVPEAHSVVLRTPAGNIVHTSDFKFDEKPTLGPKSDLKRFKEIGDEGVLAMLCDATNVFKEESDGTEGDLIKVLEGHVTGAQGALFFATFSSNIGRYIEVAKIAAKTGRKVCFLSRSLRNMVQHARKCGYFPKGLEEHVVEVDEAATLPRNKIMVGLAGTQGEPRSAMTGLSRGDSIKGLQAQKGDTLILSARFIPGNERAIYTMLNNYLQLGVKVLHPKVTQDIHISGHASRSEVRKMYQLVRPKIAVPVHGEYSHLLAQAEIAEEEGAQPFVITDGTKLYLGPDEPKILEEEAPRYGRNYIDGLNILDDDRWVLKERRLMSLEGLATVTVVTDKKGKIKGKPSVKSKGLIDEAIQPDIIKDAQQEVAKVLEDNFGACIDEPSKAEDMMRQAVRRIFNRQRGRKPVTVAQVLKV